MCILFSCTFALAAESYKIHLNGTEEQNTVIKDFTEAALFYTKNIILCDRIEVKA